MTPIRAGKNAKTWITVGVLERKAKLARIVTRGNIAFREIALPIVIL